ncbi:MAG: phosphomannomutase/phosphoglucomutase [Helicobacter sp.]|nr:phosphomannomutase/phosphoglucomutase [Helicobacter sp.]
MIFREYDIRGIYPSDLDFRTVFLIGRELGLQIARKTPACKAVYIGYDARPSAKALFNALHCGLKSVDIKVYDLGMIPTGVAYFATFEPMPLESGGHLLCPNSIMITGSHNPKQYNGFKITLNQKPFFGDDIREIGSRVRNAQKAKEEAKEKIQEQAKEMEVERAIKVHAITRFVDFMSYKFAHLKGRIKERIAFDFGNGVGAIALKEILQRLEIKAVLLYEDPDGEFPNHHPDPSEAKNLKDLEKKMKEEGIKAGFAFDGDADRIAFLTPKHNFKGDELGIIFARELKRSGLDPIVVGEVKCSKNFYDEIGRIGRAIMYKTGHSNIKTKIKEISAHFAVEVSGHIFFNDRYFGFDCALYACLRILELFLERSPADLEAEIFALPKLFSTDEEKINTTDEAKSKIIEHLKELVKSPPEGFPKVLDVVQIDGLRIIFQNGWALVRQSNTTPVLVTRFEANTRSDLENYKAKVLELIESAKGRV